MGLAPEADRDHINRRIDTLVQCALHRRTLQLSCRRCPHVRLLDAIPVWYLFARRGWSELVREAPSRFYCQECWSRRVRKVTDPKLEITSLPPPPLSDDWPYPDEREWKKLVSRYRS